MIQSRSFMFERDDIGRSIVLFTAYFLTRVFAEKWTLPVMLVLSVTIALYRLVRRRAKKRASESWAATTGRVEFAEVKRPGENGANAYVLHIAYSYKAGADRYAGFEEKRYGRESQADAAHAKIKGANVIVRYNPRNPEESLMQVAAGEL